LATPEISHLLAFDTQPEIERIAGFIRQSLRKIRRRGLVVAVSGGIDSAVCLALAVRAVGKENVVALMLPEKQISEDSTQKGEQLTKAFGVRSEIFNISEALDGLGCYREQDKAIISIFPEYEPDWKFKLVMSPEATISSYNLVLERGEEVRSVRCTSEAFRHIIAATNHKQRIRKNIEYYHAEKEHYAVIGTPNLLEYELGFFVKSGDGIADIKPISHLYKTQVYMLAEALGIDENIRTAEPTTGTFSMDQSQEEFFFRASHDIVDLALWAIKQTLPLEKFAALSSMEIEQASKLINHIRTTKNSTAYQNMPAMALPPLQVNKQ